MSVAAPSARVSDSVFEETTFTKRLERRVLRFIQQRQILSPGERVVVAISGGPDSTALLLILSRLHEALGIEITTAHFDHQLRTHEEAAGDLAFAETLAATLLVPLVADHADTRARARSQHQSIEDAARRLRYAFLGEVSKQVNASAVVTGHTLDDQAETVLLHMLRGSGLDGLSGMSPCASWSFGHGPRLARPVLCLRRADTERYCRELRVEPRCDPTNELPIAMRNRIRLELLPALRTFNPSIEEALARLADAAAQDTAFINSVADELWRRAAWAKDDSVVIPRTEIASIHPALIARLIRRAVAHLRGSTADVEAAHIDDLVAARSKPRHRASLPHGLTAVLSSRSLSIIAGEPQSAQPIPETALTLPGRTQIGAWIIETEFVSGLPDPRTAGPREIYLDADAVGRQVTIRSRRRGDRLRPLGLGGEKKLQDIFVDARVPAQERDGVPIVCSASAIAWVAGHCIDERYALHEHSRHAVHIKFKKPDS